MSALTQKRNTKRTAMRSIPLPLAAGAKATQGGAACIDTSAGSAKPGAAANANLVRVGQWAESVDNTSGTGVTYTMVDLDFEIFATWWDNATGGAAITAVFGTAYMLDDHIVGTTSSGNSASGRIWEISPDGTQVLVEATAL